MPELPEVETVRLTLAPMIGSTVAGVWTSNKPLRGKRLDTKGFRRSFEGRRVDQIRRWGKYLLIDFRGADSVLIAHLGMSGRLRLIEPSAARAKHTHAVFSLKGRRGDIDLRYSDPRRFGQLSLAVAGRETDHPSLAKLGLDPLVDGLAGDQFYELVHPRRANLKSLLLDQRLIAGIGNIYAAEALYQAEIAPTLPGHRLSRRRATALAAAVIDVLERALGHGGTSLRDFVAADGTSGENSHYLWVYDREGQRCHRDHCRAIIRRKMIQGRATFYCPTCQRR